MTRKEYKELLLKAELPEEVVDDLLSHTKDEDLVRMKDFLDGDTEKMMDALMAAVNKAEADDAPPTPPKPKPEGAKVCPKCGASNPLNAVECSECGADLTEKPPAKKGDEVEGVTKSLLTLADLIVQRIKDGSTPLEVEIDMPELGQLQVDIASLRTEVAELKDMFAALAEPDEIRLKDIVSNMSSATRVRLRQSLGDAQTVKRVAAYMQQRKDGDSSGGSEPTVDGAVIKDAAGNRYNSLADLAYGNPIK